MLLNILTILFCYYFTTFSLKIVTMLLILLLLQFITPYLSCDQRDQCLQGANFSLKICLPLLSRKLSHYIPVRLVNIAGEHGEELTIWKPCYKWSFLLWTNMLVFQNFQWSCLKFEGVDHICLYERAPLHCAIFRKRNIWPFPPTNWNGKTIGSALVMIQLQLISGKGVMKEI